MKLETKCVIAEMTGEALIGATMSIILRKTIFPKCKSGDKVIATLGTAVMAWMVGRSFCKEFYEFCDGVFGTDLI